MVLCTGEFMLITFKTKSYANITMFGDIGLKMLEMMDYGLAVPGGIVADDVVSALNNLKQALVKLPEDISTKQGEDDQPKVSIHTRAVPLLELLQSAVDNDDLVRWE